MATNEEIEAAREAYFAKSWEVYDAAPWNRVKLSAEKEQLRRALLALDPGHFSRREREVFEETARKILPPEAAERRIVEYMVSEIALELDRL
jgi:hypothetical protein